MKRKQIPKTVRDLSWDHWVGSDIAKAKCLCCGVREIKMNSFHCGHIVAAKNGGTNEVSNLKPICPTCNLSMGDKDMNEFKKVWFPPKEKVNLDSYRWTGCLNIFKHKG